MTLQARIRAQRGDFTLDAALEVNRGEVLALLGPNGSGKSTLLGAIAGLVPVVVGEVMVGDRTLTRVDNQGTRVVPTHQRGVGLLGQNPLLFPHLTVLQNVMFGGLARGDRADDVAERARHWLDAVELGGVEQRRPHALSGGQQQRVAIARALTAEPEVLLLDEPLASLDVESASAIRTLLRERLVASSMATIVVTHDLVDAVVLADRAAILDSGRLADSGATSVVLGQPVDRFAAALAGLNLLRGVVAEGGFVVVQGVRYRARERTAVATGNEVWVAFPRSAVTIHEPGAAVDTSNVWTGVVEALQPAAGGIRVVGAEIVAESSSTELLERGLRAGSPVSLRVDPAFVTFYADRAGGSIARD